MSANIGKKILKWTFLIVPWLLVLLLGGGWWLTAWAPSYLERLVPQLAADMEIPLSEFSIRNAGLFSADIGPVRLGEGDDGVWLANVHVTYTPASLKRGRIHTVILDGVSLSAVFDGKDFSLPILDQLPATAQSKTQNVPPDLPFDILTLRDAVLLCRINGQDLSVPFSADIEPGENPHFSGQLHPRDQTVEVAGNLALSTNDLSLEVRAKALRVGAFADLLPRPISGEADFSIKTRINLMSPAALSGEFMVSAAHCGLQSLGGRLPDDAEIKIRGTVADGVVAFSMDDVSLTEPLPIRLGIRSGGINAGSVFAQFNMAGAGVEMNGRLDADRRQDASGMWDVSLSAGNPDPFKLEAGNRVIRLNGFDVTLQGTASPDSADVLLKCGTSAADMETTGFKSGPVRLTLPLKWPASGKGKQGKIQLSGLRLQKRKLDSVTANISQQGTAVNFDGTLATDVLPGLRVPFSGVSSLISNRTDLSFSVKNYALTKAFKPATVAPAMKGIVLTGTIKAKGQLKIDDEGVKSSLGASLSNGSLTISENGTAIRGINASFVTPDLFGLRSAPAQQLTFDSIESGSMILSKGKIIYQLENSGSMLVEQARFDWCGGHIFSNAFRVVPASEEYGLTLYCSELKLSELLSQLGLAKAEGEAALSGELPVAWKRGKISINNGFLHSTPGESGIIRVEAMQDLVAGIPEGTPQRGQLELAQEAVRDYQYNWVRIKADTVDEDLLIRLSLDGKPVSPLPFVYRKEFGGFVRVTGNAQGSNFQGMKLDVNFSVPLNRILLYKDIVNMIQ